MPNPSDNEADFVDYIDSLKRKEQREKNEELAAKLRKEWRETTWAGALIAAVERIGAAPFFQAIGESFEGGEDSMTFYLTSVFIKICTIGAFILFVYIIGRVFNAIVGDEIVMEQEIVIVEEVTRSQLEAEERAAREKENGGGRLANGTDGEVPEKKEDSNARKRRGKRS